MMPERRSWRILSRAAIFLAVTASVTACSYLPSSVRNAPILNRLIGDDDVPVLGIDPTEQAGVDYTIAINGLGVGETPEETAENLRIRNILEGATRLYRLQDKPPPNVALLKRRAAADVSIIERALKSEGYYEGEATITVTGDDAPAVRAAAPAPAALQSAAAVTERAATVSNAAAADEGTVTAAENAATATESAALVTESAAAVTQSAAPAPDSASISDPVVKIAVRKGPRYALARQLATFTTPIDPILEQTVQDAISSNVGGPAQGRAVVDGEIEVASILGRNGYPYVDRGKRRAEANFDYDTLDVRTPYAPGPLTTYGPVTIEGLETVERKYVESFITWQQGAPVSRPEIAQVQRALSSTRLFNAVSIVLPTDPPEGWEESGRFEAPITLVFEEAKHRKATAALNFSTVDGPGGIATWENRNLFGQNETLQAVLDVSLEEQRARLDYRKPRWVKTRRDLIAALELFREDRDAYESIGANGSIGIEERLRDWLTATVGLGFEVAQTTESNGDERNSYLIGIPGSLVYDRTDDLLNPTEGARITATATPWAGAFDDEFTSFLETDIEASTYISLDRDARYIFAIRGRVAQVFSDEANNIPANRRVYSGGGGSVRAFGSQYVNDLDSDGNTVGALGVVEGSAELRIRFGNFGIVPFVDAGIISNEFMDDFGTLRWGPGIGVRYFSPVGPIRLDVAVPIDPRDEDDAFQFYLSIGQAF